MVADQSVSTVMWTISELGVKYKDKLTRRVAIPSPGCTAPTTRADRPSCSSSPETENIGVVPGPGLCLPRFTGTRTAG